MPPTPTDRAIVQVAQDLAVDLPDRPVVPQLTSDQALFLSFLMESNDLATATKKYNDQAETPADLEAWAGDEQFQEALVLMRENRRMLFHALTFALFGRAFRGIAELMAMPTAAAKEKGILLLMRIHGMLIDKVKIQDPTETRSLLQELRRQMPVSVVEGQYTEVQDERRTD